MAPHGTLTLSYTHNKLVLYFYCCPIVEGQGQTDDFFIETKTVLVSGSGGLLHVTLRVDGVALEPDETFQLKLTTNPDLKSEGVFVVDTLDVTIQDPDSKIKLMK